MSRARKSNAKSWTGDGYAPDQVYVVGCCYADFEMVAHKLKKGSRILLKRHPSNPYDANAITCWFPHPELGQVRIGYLDRHSARRLATFMDRGFRLDAIVQHVAHDIAVRIRRNRGSVPHMAA